MNAEMVVTTVEAKKSASLIFMRLFSPPCSNTSYIIISIATKAETAGMLKVKTLGSRMVITLLVLLNYNINKFDFYKRNTGFIWNRFFNIITNKDY